MTMADRKAPTDLPPPYTSSDTSDDTSDSDVFIPRINPSKTPCLQKPIAIPATSKKLGSPFLRAYPPVLEQYGISSSQFLDLIDELNRSAVKSPPLQVLGLAGTVVSFVPIHTAQIVGTAVDVGSKVAAYAVSKGRTELFIRKVNKNIFVPLGLKLEISKIDALAKVAGIPILDDNGKVKVDAPLLEPLDREALLQQGSTEGLTTGQQRRLDALTEYIARLDLTALEDVHKSRNPFSNWSAAASERQRNREEKRLMKSRIRASNKYERGSGKALRKMQKESDELEGDVDDLARTERKLQRRQDKIERKNAKMIAKGKSQEEIDEKLAKRQVKLAGREAELVNLRSTQPVREVQEQPIHAAESNSKEVERQRIQEEYDMKMQKVESKRMKKDKEEAGMRTILWIIIRNLDETVEGENPDLSDEDVERAVQGLSVKDSKDIVT